ncbi:MAG TPA: 16S rRNA (guanine(527)-N(7))-methyltransferase RsmG [Verrucomicrobiae bacterium]|nr:16S rRNA (guanine(527)-N(7))-methyltransferase RsmG [Verrucomicrobiae bacterium]
MSDSAIERLLAPFAFSPTPLLCGQIRDYSALLLRWNRKVALTTVVEPSEIVRFHFGESLFALSLLPITQGRLADLGSGAGFPGLALKLASPDLHVTLVESNVKKAAFLSEAIRLLGLQHAEVFRGRVEDFPATLGSFDLVTARALGSHDEVLHWAMERLSPGGRLALWISGHDASALAIETSWVWEPPALIPETKNRYILVGARRQ